LLIYIDQHELDRLEMKRERERERERGRESESSGDRSVSKPCPLGKSNDSATLNYLKIFKIINNLFLKALIFAQFVFSLSSTLSRFI